MPKATTKYKGVPTPSVERRNIDSASMTANDLFWLSSRVPKVNSLISKFKSLGERPATSAAYFKDVVIPSSSMPSSDVGDVPTGDPRMKDPQPGRSIATSLEGESMQMAGCSLLSSGDVINVCKQDIQDNIAWLKKVSPDQKRQLKNYLLNLDASQKVDFTTGGSRYVRERVDEITRKICQNIAEKDHRFKGNLVPMGSSRNDTKVGDANEFDFVYELVTHVLLNEKGTFSHCDYTNVFSQHGSIDRDNIYVTFATETDYELCKSFVIKVSRSDASGDDANNSITCKLDIDVINEIFCYILNNVLQELELPPGWCYSGFNRPKYSGIRTNGIAYLLQFEYKRTDEEAPLRLSVDFVPMIRIPDVLDKFEVILALDEFIKNRTEEKHCWVSIASRHWFFNHAEEEWLTQYSAHSMPKTTMRICKELGSLLKMNVKRAIDRNNLKRITIQQGKNSICSLELPSDGDQHIKFDTDEYVTCSDLGETFPDNSLVKSYAVKRIVMHMMMASESHGHNWTENDLPDLVICVYRFLCHVRDLVMDSNFSVPDEFVENRFSVPLEDNSELNEDLECSVKLEAGRHLTDFNLEYTYNHLLTELGVIQGTRDLLGSNPKSLQLSGMSAVFQLLRCVCERHNTAEIVTHKAVIPRGDCDYVTKEEYKEMLANKNTETLMHQQI